MASDSRTVGLLPPIRGPHDFASAFDVSRETLGRLETYAALLAQWQKAVNLVAPATLGEVWGRHFADSAQLAGLAPGARTWVDLGSGAGFPGLVVAMLMAGTEPRGSDPSPTIVLKSGNAGARGLTPFPASAQGDLTPPRVTLVESNARKCAFLREVVRRTALEPGVAVDILSTRIETAATQARLHGPGVVSARALAPLDKLLALAAPLFTSATVGLFMKGRGLAAELEAAQRQWNFHAELAPSRTDRDGRILVIRNLQPKNEGLNP
ncbi:MAG TPA: 16S rRNA (guanine(527)-N(7))-methyltransferase RsmG [Hyphomicrobiaceae bacterium]|nr:16S rRNA (guanine(527)-N(7))-methyltransferase RsmG [Hyphomicrobiaceae bacterium]